MAITIDTTFDAATQLASGPRPPSVKLALWNAALSTMQTVEKNNAYGVLLRMYRDEPLPLQRNVLYEQLREVRGCLFGSHIDALYYIQYLDETGQLAGYERIGKTLIEQVEWRNSIYKLMHGHGMTWKTISFAALILDPLHCELIPIDRHVMARLGKTKRCGKADKDSPQQLGKYLVIEQEVRTERNNAGYEHLPLGLWHWFKWEGYRYFVARSSQGNGDIESHNGLSCRY